MAADEKKRESRLRHAARRQGLSLRKSRSRDPGAEEYGKWRILDATGRIVREWDILDEIEDHLEQRR
ncbi:MAG: hypothetical protein U0R71_03010 [Solirubrobacterales bacterium]